MQKDHGRWVLAVYISNKLPGDAEPGQSVGHKSRQSERAGLGQWFSASDRPGTTGEPYKYLPSPQQCHIGPVKSEVQRVGFRHQYVFQSPGDFTVQAGGEPVESLQSPLSQEAVTGMARPFHTERPRHCLGLPWYSGLRATAQWH